MLIIPMKTPFGNIAQRQYIINTFEGVRYFQSYFSIVIKETRSVLGPVIIELDKHYWNHSVTTVKYRNQFLGETSKTVKRKINNGQYTLVDLNLDNF